MTHNKECLKILKTVKPYAVPHSWTGLILLDPAFSWASTILRRIWHECFSPFLSVSCHPESLNAAANPEIITAVHWQVFLLRSEQPLFWSRHFLPFVEMRGSLPYSLKLPTGLCPVLHYYSTEVKVKVKCTSWARRRIAGRRYSSTCLNLGSGWRWVFRQHPGRSTGTHWDGGCKAPRDGVNVLTFWTRNYFFGFSTPCI